MANNQMPQPPLNLGAIKKQLETAPFEVCGAEPEQQIFKQMRDPKKLMTGDSAYETCTSREFIKTFMFKKLSALVSPTGVEQTVELQVLKCAVCGASKIVK
ncbi:MAG: hypothetical protein ACU85E_14390 [Gammaproteobacteria bacterium]